jgi:hypothetical protein
MQKTELHTARISLTPDATFVASGVYEHGDFRRNRQVI